jgi:hypothetical protein
MNDDVNNGLPVKKLVIGAVVVLLVLFFVALWSGWIGLSLDSNEDRVKGQDHEKLDLKVSFDRTELRQDARETAQELAGLGDKAEVLADMENAEGRLQRVDAAGETLTIAQDDRKEPLVVRVNDATTFELKSGKKGELEALHVGDYVRVVYQTKNEVNWAHEITVTTAPRKSNAS